ncbi:MAG TPA: hypothetical protein VFU47_01450, partial [Armatimonadota bacterium]|nr:hypothetical protein [Armatimonadota bacterium]
TPVTEALRQTGARAATLNRSWSLYQVPDALLPPNTSLAYGWRDAQGYDSLYLGAYRPLADRLAGPDGNASPPENGNIVFIKRADSPLMPLLGARYVVSQEPLTRGDLLPASGFPPGPPYVYQDTRALPEAYLATTWFPADPADGLSRLASMPPGAAFVPPGAPVAMPEPGPAGATATEATLVRRSAGLIEVSVSAARPSLLVLSEGYHPGWKVTLERAGRPAEAVRPVRVNSAFQGVYLPPGPATLRWRFEPASFRLGLFLGLCACAVLCALAGRRR